RTKRGQLDRRVRLLSHAEQRVGRLHVPQRFGVRFHADHYPVQRAAGHHLRAASVRQPHLQRASHLEPIHGGGHQRGRQPLVRVRRVADHRHLVGHRGTVGSQLDRPLCIVERHQQRLGQLPLPQRLGLGFGPHSHPRQRHARRHVPAAPVRRQLLQRAGDLGSVHRSVGAGHQGLSVWTTQRGRPLVRCLVMFSGGNLKAFGARRRYSRRALTVALALALGGVGPGVASQSAAEAEASAAGIRSWQPDMTPTLGDVQSTPSTSPSAPVGPSQTGPQGQALSQAPGATFQVAYDAGFQANPSAMAAFQAAVDIWALKIKSAVPIRIAASFADLGYSPGSYTLGMAGPALLIADFPHQPNTAVYYPLALANAIAGAQQYPSTSCSCDIAAQFNNNSNVTPTWYFGTDGNPGPKNDFESVVLHELGHGLGFFGIMSYSG